MKFELKISEKDFIKFEMYLFAFQDFPDNTDITLRFFENEEEYRYKTVKIGEINMLATC